MKTITVPSDRERLYQVQEFVEECLSGCGASSKTLLQLQLVVYLNAAMELEAKKHPDKEIIPAGILYYQIQDPVLDLEPEECSDSGDFGYWCRCVGAGRIE